jgi:hypothetical protein
MVGTPSGMLRCPLNDESYLRLSESCAISGLKSATGPVVAICLPTPLSSVAASGPHCVRTTINNDHSLQTRQASKCLSTLTFQKPSTTANMTHLEKCGLKIRTVSVRVSV